MTIDDVKKSIDGLKQSADEATEGFKSMQKVLLVFCGIATLAIVMITVKIINDQRP